MDLGYEKKGEVCISIKQYIEKIIESVPEENGLSMAATLAAVHLFQIRDEKEAKLLLEEQAIQFHHTVVPLLFECISARQDIETAIAFLSTGLKAPDVDDQAKLKRNIKYLNST